jgi:hypothetical protein
VTAGQCGGAWSLNIEFNGRRRVAYPRQNCADIRHFLPRTLGLGFPQAGAFFWRRILGRWSSRDRRLVQASVLILKLSYSLLLKADRPTTKAFNRSENVVGWFGPSERLWIGVSGLDVRVDRALEFGRRSRMRMSV